MSPAPCAEAIKNDQVAGCPAPHPQAAVLGVPLSDQPIPAEDK